MMHWHEHTSSGLEAKLSKAKIDILFQSNTEWFMPCKDNRIVFFIEVSLKRFSENTRELEKSLKVSESVW